MRVFSILNEDLKITAPPQGLANTTGTNVANLQKALETLGYSVGSTGVDGVYGSRTARAVRQFQKDHGLTIDGDAGPATVPVILRALKNKDLDVEPAADNSVKSKEIQSPAIVQPTHTGNIDGKVLDLIAAPESAGRYDAVYPNQRNADILKTPIKELLRDMKKRIQTQGSSATGRYQYTYNTLRSLVNRMGLDPSTPFAPKTQDRIALYHLKKDHGLDQWKAGRLTDRQFLEMLSRTWAGLPDPATGSSYYKDVPGNKANVSALAALSTLQKIRRTA